MGKIVERANVWDLHVHTPIGTKTQKNYGGISNKEFIDKIIEIYENAENKIGMISFTDHNTINVEAYKLFMDKKTGIAIIPGIEMDVFLSEKSNTTKHVIFYFSESELETIGELENIINSFLSENEKVYFSAFVSYLINKGKIFSVSPHAFKQNNRGITSDWVDEESAKRGVNDYTGAIFPFWEASGKTEISRAIEFLNSQTNDNEDRETQAVIAFSDSSNFEKVQKYINNPNQYFNCLNSYQGLLLAGTDTERIIYQHEIRPLNGTSEKIKKVTYSKNLTKKTNNNVGNIEFSDRLNVIIGGRGEGKSALLDAIALAINGSIGDSSREKFVQKFGIEIENYKGNVFPKATRIMYFCQSYINKLFDGKTQVHLKDFFKEEFAYNAEISDSYADVEQIVKSGKHENTNSEVNIMDSFSDFKDIEKKTEFIKAKSKKIERVKLIKDDKTYLEKIKEVLPNSKELWDSELDESLKEFVDLLLTKICKINYRNLLDYKFENIMEKHIRSMRSKIDEANKKKEESRKDIEEELKYLFEEKIQRMRQINKLYDVPSSMTEITIKFHKAEGAEGNLFYFVTYSNREHPVEYAKRLICEMVDKKREKINKNSTEEILRKYATTDYYCDKIKDSESFRNLEEEIDSLNSVKIDKQQKIIYFDGESYTDLHKSSPGTQTNAIMEYIFNNNSKVPLLIDQPEDNIDNKARYSQLTKWIREQKYRRQIILVTHDANVVINGDAENVIIAEYKNGEFSYKYGALEYENNLEEAAEILDGGKVAIRRRIAKYGE